jgi:CBS domain-containing protein
MRDENIGSVVVAEDERPLGIVTDRDLAIRVIADGRDSEKLRLREIMSREPIFLGGDRSLDQVIAAMRDLAIRRIPIVDAEGLLSGIVSLDDILLRLSDQLGNLAAAVRAELSRER